MTLRLAGIEEQMKINPKIKISIKISHKEKNEINLLFKKLAEYILADDKDTKAIAEEIEAIKLLLEDEVINVMFLRSIDSDIFTISNHLINQYKNNPDLSLYRKILLLWQIKKICKQWNKIFSSILDRLEQN